MSIDAKLTEIEQTMKTLAPLALRVKDERDEAVRLLKEGLLYEHIGERGPFKTKVRDFLEKVGQWPSVADLVKRDMIARHEGRPDQDLDTCGRPLKAGS